MKKIFLLSISILIVILVTACSSQIFFKAAPLDEKETYNGREIVTKGNNDASVSIEFDGQVETDFVFYVEIENRSEDMLIIDPRDIFAEAVRKDLITIDDRFELMWAVDPQVEITRLVREKESRKKMHSVNTGLNTAFTLLSIINTLSDNNSRNDGHKIVRDVVFWADNQVREEVNYNETMKSLEYQRSFWKNEALNYTELKKDQRIGGLIFLPFNPKVKFIRLVIPIKNFDFEFYFKQVKID